jgi:hypothetical protein
MAAMTRQWLLSPTVLTLLSTLAAPQAAAQERQAPAGAPGGAAPAFKPPMFADDTLMYVFGPAPASTGSRASR